MSEKFESRYADVNDIRLHYVSVGKGPLMLFVHGFPEFWAEWEDQLDFFGRSYQAVALDMRGYNLSSKPEAVEAYHASLLIKDLKALIEHLGHQKCILVAHDWGGAVAWSFVMAHPEMVEKLVIINSPHPAVFTRELLNNPAQQKASAYMNQFRLPGVEQVLAKDDYAQLQYALFSPDTSRWEPTAEIRQKYIKAWSQPGALTGGLNYYRVSPLYPPTSEEDQKRLKSIADLPVEMFAVKVPTLVIWGEGDHALGIGNLEGLDNYITDLTIERIPEGTHWVIHEQPDRVNALIMAFINKNTP